MWNLANVLTLSRFVTAPLFVVLLLRFDREPLAATAWSLFALVLFTLLTDMFDGLAARSQNQVTDFGKIMDPVADSTFFMTALFAFSATESFAVPIWMPLVVLYREIAMHVLRRYAALKGVVLAAKVSGKAKMAAQSIILTGLMLAIALRCGGHIDFSLDQAAFWCVLVIVVANILSMPEYLAGIPALARNRAANTDSDQPA